MFSQFPREVQILIWEFDPEKKSRFDFVVHQMRLIPVLEELIENVHFYCRNRFIKQMMDLGFPKQSLEVGKRKYFISNTDFGWHKNIFYNRKVFGFREVDRYFFWNKFIRNRFRKIES